MSSVALAAPTSESHCGDQAARNSRDVRFECVCVYPARPFQAYTHDKNLKKLQQNSQRLPDRQGTPSIEMFDFDMSMM